MKYMCRCNWALVKVYSKRQRPLFINLLWHETWRLKSVLKTTYRLRCDIYRINRSRNNFQRAEHSLKPDIIRFFINWLSVRKRKRLDELRIRIIHFFCLLGFLYNCQNVVNDLYRMSQIHCRNKKKYPQNIDL